MTDIDFEELDRAVHSLMNQRQQVSAPGSQVVGAADESQGVSSAAEEASAPTSTPSIRRSSGRFMDVVAPASTKAGRVESSTPFSPRTGVTLQPITQTPSIDGVVTRPHSAGATTSSVAANAMPMTSPLDASDDAPQTAVPSASPDEDRIARMTDEIAASLARSLSGDEDAPAAEMVESSDATEAADTIDMAEVMAVEALETSVDVNPVADTSSGADSIEPQQPPITETPAQTGMPIAPPTSPVPAEATPMPTPEPTEPLSSPFLENTAVEKRPLGGYAEATPEAADVSSTAPAADQSPAPEIPEPDVADPMEHDKNQATQPSVDIAPEFDQELMALESTAVEPLPEPTPPSAPVADEPAADTPSKPPTTAQEIFAAPIDSIDEFAVGDLDQKMERAIAEPGASAVAQPAPTMRRQQPLEVPKPEPAYGDDDDLSPEPLPMFDAASEQPAGPTKHSSAASTFLVILLLLLIGAGGGVAAYYFLLVQ